MIAFARKNGTNDGFAKYMFSQADANKDGKLTFEEVEALDGM